MTLNFSTRIEFFAGGSTKAVFDSVSTDNEFYPENPVQTKISHNKKILIEIESEHIPQLRANLNSTLRLIQASYDTIKSVKI